MLPEITADWLLARTREGDGGCLVWVRYSQRGDPKATFGVEAIPMNVRRVVWAALTSRAPLKNHVIRSCCGTLNCVEPSHLVQLQRSQLLAGKKQTHARRQKSATAARSKSHLTPDAIASMRAGDASQQVLADQWSVSQSMVSKIQRGHAWREYGGHFVGLGAR